MGKEKSARPDMATVSVAVAPAHLRRLGEICSTFGRSEDTVKKWRKDGAPIAFDGVSYSAEYNQLQAWLVAQNR